MEYHCSLGFSGLLIFPPRAFLLRSSIMDFHVGLKGKDFTMLCCDTAAVQQIITIKSDEEKLLPIDSHKLFAVSGAAGDRAHFSELIIAQCRLYALRNNVKLTTYATANLTRQELAVALRKVWYSALK